MHCSSSALLVFALLSPAAKLTSQDAPASIIQPHWETDLKARHQALIASNGPGTDTELRDQLLAMRDKDQEARGFRAGEPIDKDHYQQATNLAEIDRDLTAQLKQITETRGWPTIHLVGIKASNAAMLILTHSADHSWQRALLPQLEQLSDAGRIDGSALALVIDKELVASGKLQRYGSQFKFLNGEMAMYAVEDPAGLDGRRAQALLPPIDAYKLLLAQIYHLKPSAKLATATPPTSAP